MEVLREGGREGGRREKKDGGKGRTEEEGREVGERRDVANKKRGGSGERQGARQGALFIDFIPSPLPAPPS